MRVAPSYALRGVFSSCFCVRATSPSAVLLRSRTSACSTDCNIFFFFLFLPFLLYAPCQIHGRAAPHLFAFLPLSSSDPNVRVRKHIHFSDPQRRVPSSRFEASRQKQIETRDGHRHSQDFFSLANKTQHHKHTLLKCAFAAAGDIIQVLPE